MKKYIKIKITKGILKILIWCSKHLQDKKDIEKCKKNVEKLEKKLKQMGGD